MYLFLQWICVCSCLWLHNSVAQLFKCGGNGFNGCSHVFAGSTSWSATRKAPRGLEVLSQKGMLAGVCEDGIIASLYDCTLKISLWSAIALRGWQVFEDPDNIPKKPRNRQGWHHGEGAGDIAPRYLQQYDYYRPNVLRQMKVNKGHLVPRYYAGLDVNENGRERRVRASYTFFNLVPQTEELNGEKWSKCERELISWAKAGVNMVREDARLGFDEAKRRTKLYVIVGAVPRVTYLSSASPGKRQQYFGSNGLGDGQNDTHPVNFPLAVWTAACLLDVKSGRKGYYTVFWNWNEQELKYNCRYPWKDAKHFLGYGDGGGLSMGVTHGMLGQDFLDGVQLFPGQRQCQDGTYKPLLYAKMDARAGYYRFID